MPPRSPMRNARSPRNPWRRTWRAPSARIGLSTGPWIRTSRTEPDQPAAHGHFVSLWRRDGNGRLRVEVDIGIRHRQAIGKPRTAYEAFASPRFMLYRWGHAPWRGKPAALASDAMREGPTLWLADAVVTARSNEFGYVRGTFADKPGVVRGYFMRVWRREGADWHVVLDVTNAAN